MTDYVGITFLLGSDTIFENVAPIETTAGTYSRTNTVNITADTIQLRIRGYQRPGDNNPNGATYIQSVTVEGTGANPFGGSSAFVTTVRTTNHGATFGSPVTAGDASSNSVGFDTQRIGDLVFAGVISKIVQATNGGTYSDTTNGGTTGTFARLLRSYGQSGTKLIIGTPTAISGETLWKLDSTQTAITPTNAGIDGLVVSPNCVDMWITSDSAIVGIFNFSGTYRLGRSTNGGSSWSFTTSNITTDSTYLRVRQSNTARKQVYIIQADATVYSNDGGATTQLKSSPSDSLIGIEVKS